MTHETNMDEAAIARAVGFLRQEDVVACPTETVYGLFADALSDAAVQKIYKVKGRPSCNPLIVHVFDIAMAERTAELDERARRVLEHFWCEKQAPLTVVLRMRDGALRISKFATAGLDTVALRRPNHPVALRMIELFCGPLAAPSANTSNGVSPTSFDMVIDDIGAKVPLVLDGGLCDVGIESTILDLTCDVPRILRPGGVAGEEIEDFLGCSLDVQMQNDDGVIKAPGMMKKHYAPSIPVRLNAAFALPGEAFIAFGSTGVQCDLNLSVSGDLREAGRNLFRALKSLDLPGKFTGIAIMPIPSFDIGVGINDRLIRAATS